MISSDADLPFSQACENNKRPILDVLRRHLRAGDEVLEVGSGTGQHAVFFADQLDGVVWQPSDRRLGLGGLAERVTRFDRTHLRPPLALDVDVLPWRVRPYDVVFSANTLHIVSWSSVERFFRGVGALLQPGGRLIVYGPFNYDGAFTSASNAAFDASLRVRDPQSGIRDFEQVDRLARAAGLRLVEDSAMPANNRTLVWCRAASAVGS
mgnify:CR=1 FL=1